MTDENDRQAALDQMYPTMSRPKPAPDPEPDPKAAQTYPSMLHADGRPRAQGLTRQQLEAEQAEASRVDADGDTSSTDESSNGSHGEIDLEIKFDKSSENYTEFARLVPGELGPLVSHRASLSGPRAASVPRSSGGPAPPAVSGRSRDPRTAAHSPASPGSTGYARRRTQALAAGSC